MFKTTKKNPSASVFQVQKKHSWRGSLIRLLEVLLIIIVLLGTGIWYLNQSHFSVSKFINSTQESLKPKVETQKKVEQKTPQDELKTEIEKSKVFEIESIKEVTGGFEVKAKNGPTVVFSKEKDFAETIRTLQTLLAKAKIDNKSVRQVDFRFEKIVVQY